jgi:hypothetical protein
MVNAQQRAKEAKRLGLKPAEYRKLTVYEKAQLHLLLKESEAKQLSSAAEVAKAVPETLVDTLGLGLIWSTTHKGGINKEDLILGFMGSIILRNCWGSMTGSTVGIGYLTLLGYNFADDWLLGGYKSVAEQIHSATQGGQPPPIGIEGIANAIFPKPPVEVPKSGF